MPLPWRTRAKAAPAAPVSPAGTTIDLDDDPFAAAPQYQPVPQVQTVEVPGYVQATQSVTWDSPMLGQVYIHGPSKNRLGTIAAEDAVVVREHGEYFRPLEIPVAFPAEG
jgi:hypothetical protein